MTVKTPFILKRLRISKMPGFPHGLDGYENLADGINIIAGPNASGKSSTARIIQQLIWRNRTEGLQAEGTVNIGNEPWELKIDSNHIRVQRNGQDEELSVLLPPAESNNRYMLALHELVTENEDDLARQIARESIGGFDPDQAAMNLEYGPTVRNKSSIEYRNYEKAGQNFREVRDEHNNLKDEETRLGSLYEKREEAERAASMKDFYEKFTGCLSVAKKFTETQIMFRTLPEILGKVSGEEYKQILELEEENESLITALRDAGKKNEENNAALSLLNLPDGGIGDEVIDEMETRINDLGNLYRKAGDIDEKLRHSGIREMEALKNIGTGTDPSGWEGIDLKDVAGLDRFFHDMEKNITERQQWLAAIKEMEADPELQADTTPEILVEGIKILSNWLRETRDPAENMSWVIPVMAGITLMAGLLGLYAGWAWLVSLALVILVWWLARFGKKTTRMTIRENDFSNTGLAGPSGWTADQVSDHLELLISNLTRAKNAERIARKLEDYRKQLEKFDQKLEIIGERRSEWLEKLKVIPTLPGEDLDSGMGLYWFLDRVRKWQENHELTLTLGREAEENRENIRIETERINALFKNLGMKTASDFTQMKSVYKKCKEDEKIRRELTGEVGRISREAGLKKEQLNKNESRLRMIYEKLSLEPGEKDRVRELTGMLEEYKLAKNSYMLAEASWKESEAALKKHTLYLSQQPGLQDMSLEQAEDALLRYDREAKLLPALQREIAEIETRIGDHKKGHNLEDAIAEKDAALEDLRRLYEENLSSVTGHLIVSNLKKITSEQNRPAVFKRAGALLNRITRGRYELRLEEREEPAFRAFDTKNRIGQTLSELSTGTRVQLLLAVRLAFIETQEPAIRLPVMADELLANCDDIRASAIIDALTEISRQGRQIFYFTAQDDEVARWKTHLGDEDTNFFRIIRLTGTGEEHPPKAVLNTIPSFIHEVPLPRNPDHEDYGRKLGVPGFHITEDKPSQLHLWYLIDDNYLLHDLLSMGLVFYGQLESLTAAGESIRGITPEIRREISNKILVLERFVELWRTGRSRPIDRSILERSGAVSDKFIDEVSALLGILENDPLQLTEQLRHAGVTGFRQNKTEQLEEYLRREGFIDDRPLIPEDKIWERVKNYGFNNRIEASMAEEFLKRILMVTEKENSTAG